MKGIIVFILIFLVFSTIKLQIKVSEPYQRHERMVYELSCLENVGEVLYSVKGLPKGSEVVGNRILLPLDAEGPFYVLQIKAEDTRGQSGELVTAIMTSVNQDVEETILTTTQLEMDEAANTSTRFNSIISTYSSISESARPKYEGNRFPEKQLPTEGDPNAFNPSALRIFNSEAQTSSSNRNAITADDKLLRAVSERHQNSVKAITNLLSIIDQGRSNKQQAQRNIEKYTQLYNFALASQRSAQNIIIKIENKLAQAKSAQGGLKNLKNDIESKISQIASKPNELKNRKIQLLEKVGGEEKIKINLIKELQETNTELAESMQKVTLKEQQCQSIETEFEQLKMQLDFSNIQLSEVISERKQAEILVENKKSKVEKLRQQLATAEVELTDAQIKMVQIKAQQDYLPRTIRQYQNQLEELQIQFSGCKTEAINLNKYTDSLRNEDVIELSDQIKERQVSILGLRKQISDLDNRIAESLKELGSMKAELNKSVSDLDFIQKQVFAIDDDLRAAYIEGNDVNTEVMHAKQNVVSALNRYKKESKVVSEATLNLEKARAEQALARQTIEETIAKYSDALPYSVLPTRNIKRGTPAGNNPAGSALETRQTSTKIKIRDWAYFLSNAFGVGIKTNYNEEVTSLYSFSIVQDGQILNQRTLRGRCGGYGAERVASGIISEIQKQGFVLTTEHGHSYNIKLSSCTKLNSNIPNYHFQVGNYAIVKGISTSEYQINGSQVVCLG